MLIATKIFTGRNRQVLKILKRLSFLMKILRIYNSWQKTKKKINVIESARKLLRQNEKIKIREGMEVQLHAFSILVVDCSQCSHPQLGHFNPDKSVLDIIKEKDAWAPKLGWMLKNTLFSAGNYTAINRTSSPSLVIVPNTLHPFPQSLDSAHIVLVLS